MAEYAHPEVLVSPDWVEQHRNDSNVRLVEVDVDTTAYDSGHIPGAVGWNWTTQLCDPVKRDIVSKEELERLLSESGISNDTTIVLYGDNNNWFAAWAFWQLKLYGHKDVRLMNGGRKKWELDQRETTTEVPSYPKATYKAAEPDMSLRALAPEVIRAVDSGNVDLVDVRSPAEFKGEVTHPQGLNEGAQRAGHIPGAASIPWAQTVNEDGTFKTVQELKELYASKGVDGDKPIIAYCRIGERSSHSWFVLTYLLGYGQVKNYDGSWTEWGNMVGVPVEQGAA